MDGKIWSGSDDCSIRVWDESVRKFRCFFIFQTGVLIQDLGGHAGGILCLLVVGKQIWSGSADKTIRTWDAAVKVIYFSELTNFRVVVHFAKCEVTMVGLLACYMQVLTFGVEAVIRQLNCGTQRYDFCSK